MPFDRIQAIPLRENERSLLTVIKKHLPEIFKESKNFSRANGASDTAFAVFGYCSSLHEKAEEGMVLHARHAGSLMQYVHKEEESDKMHSILYAMNAIIAKASGNEPVTEKELEAEYTLRYAANYDHRTMPKAAVSAPETKKPATEIDANTVVRPDENARAAEARSIVRR